MKKSSILLVGIGCSLVSFLTQAKQIKEHPYTNAKKGTTMSVIKVIIPAAGLGTRFLPFTKAVPKEMLPLLDIPAMQNIIKEGINSGILYFYIITSKEKQPLANHFDAPSSDLKKILEAKDKIGLLASIDDIMKSAQFAYIRQPEPLGLGHAILMARHVINEEFFGIFLPDDIIFNDDPALAQLINVAQEQNASVIAVQEVPEQAVSSYGIIAPKSQVTPDLYEISHLVEKPAPKDAPSNLAIVGRYVLSHKVFDSLEAIQPHAVGELQLTDAIDHMIQQGHKVYAYKIKGNRFDIGTPHGWIKANIYLALRDPRYADEVKAFIAKELKNSQ